MVSPTWFPLESNPDVMNRYLASLGVEAATHAFYDVYGLEPELLDMVPKPVRAVVLLYPLTRENEALVAAQKAEADGGGAFFLRQFIHNACGTVGLLHAVANNRDEMKIAGGSFLDTFFRECAPLNPAERGDYLMTSEKLDSAHDDACHEGQSTLPPIDTPLSLHFVTFVCKNGQLVQLDGRLEHPVVWGKSTDETLLSDTAAVVKKVMAANPDEQNFTVIALSKAQ
ncbi:Ubiquitin carboxyl-terminal hydrolase 3 [Diplonema papillatum]|nr:Ubiquitin carboxyl-terminal hydrolase 3 [Diplonema papillatum]|eukprot:gene9806-15215_t